MYELLQKGSERVIQLLKTVATMIISVPKEVDVLAEELEKLRVPIREAVDGVAVPAVEEKKTNELMKKKATQIYFSLEDVIDEWNSCLQHEKMNSTAILQYMMHDENEHCYNGCVTLACENAKFVNIRYYDRLQIALKIQHIKSDISEIKDDLKIKEGQISSTKNSDMAWKILQRSPYPGQTKIVGFEAQIEKLIDWLEDGREKCNVLVVVGMAGQGKTTLAKQIFDNNEVVGKFERRIWIKVSDFDSPKKFFRFMLKNFYEPTGQKDKLPHGFYKMGLKALKNRVKNHLCKKRYVLFFDDVWNKQFLNEIEHTFSKNTYGSRIIITTRNKEVAETCNLSSVVDVEVHEMQPLTQKESLKLFCQVAFKLDIDKKDCPRKFVKLSTDIANTCDGLPLGIVAIGKHVRRENVHTFKWKSKIQEVGITKSLGLSYDCLLDHLKPCLLYFGIYPQDSAVKSTRLIRQWIAEGFVSPEKEKTLEEVAEDYLTSLINRNLVQVYSLTIDGKPRSCRVHYLVYDMILRKFEDLSFCHCINEDNQSDVSGILTRHLSIATNSKEELGGFFDHLPDEIQSSFLRSLHFFTKEKLPPIFVSRILKKSKTLKVLDFENCTVSYNFHDLGGLIHLKYLSFRNTQVGSLPKSIGKLINLETLDLRESKVNVIPEEVGKLRKLQHLLGDNLSLIQLKDHNIGGMRSLKTLRDVIIDEGVDEVKKKLEKLWHIRDFGVTNVGQEHGSALCSAINKMNKLEKLSIIAKESENEVIDLENLKKPSKLRKLRLQGKLNSLPTWVPDLDCLVKLVLSGSKLTVDPLNSLKDIPNLLFLSIINEAYEGEYLHFQGRDFEELKELELGSLRGLRSITIDSQALLCLKKLVIRDIPQLKTVPFGIQHLKNLEDLNYQNMPIEFCQELQIINDLPHVRISSKLVNDKNPRQ